MAKIEYFAVDEENVEVVKWLLDQRCMLIPDMHYDSPAMTQLVDSLQVREVAASTPHFFVICEDLLESPVKMREVTEKGKRFFYVYPRTGGPILEFYWGRHFEKEHRQHLSASWISHYDWYEDSVTGHRTKISKGLLDVYSGFITILRAKRRRVQPGQRAFYISPLVEDHVRNGTILVGLESMPVDQILGKGKC